MKQSSYYAVIPGSVRYDAALCANAKLMYGEIAALANGKGFCWAGNEYFADLYQVSKETISRWVSQLNAAGYIEVEILHNEGNKRRITIDKKIKRSPQKRQEVMTKKSIPHDKNVNPIYENTTINTTINISADTPFEFLEKNHLQKLEASLMKFKSKMPDFDKFREYYNLRVVKDGTPWTGPQLIASMELIANTWIENAGKGQGNTAPVVNNPSGQKIQFKRN